MDGSPALKQAISMINQGVAGCVVIRDGRIVESEAGDGIGPIIRLYEKSVFEGSFVVDKIVGKAAAMLFVLGGVSGVYGLTMSEAGRDYLLQHGVSAQCGQCPAYIQNRMGNGMCPMELTVADLEDPKAALTALRATRERLRSAQ